MVSRLPKKRLQQMQAMEPVLGQDAPCSEVAEALNFPANRTARIESQVNAYNVFLVEQHEPVVWRLGRPWYPCGGGPSRGADPLIQVPVQELTDTLQVDGSNWRH
jgi:hypothetical protein